nr:hypothetical protein [Ramlibacter montanisoli]
MISTSIAYTPKRAEAAQGEPGLAVSPGSMKWFMPPMRSTGSHRQVDTQEPSTVVIAPSRAAWYWPGRILTASTRNSRSK